jgi:hypothetical protein
MSKKALASQCCKEFASMIQCIFSNEYLCILDANNLKHITRLHHRLHGALGMLDSLDCMNADAMEELS